MKRYLLLISAFVVSILPAVAKEKNNISRPKLVVGIVVDQMRWDYLYRYYDRYSSGGFKRLIQSGYNCQNTQINYLPSFTAPGHTCIYTGSVPALHGIAGNDWVEVATDKKVYCTDDDTVTPIGCNNCKAGKMSPKNLLASTITDELKLATNKKSRVYGVALKDRGSILPAGHMANAAYWYNDEEGTFISSSFYSNPNPSWLKTFNNRHLADSLTAQSWETLYPIASYVQSVTDSNGFEKPFSGETTPTFPHKYVKNYSMLKATPAGNTITLELAKSCISGEQLGQESETDFLCVSLSSTDYVGHQFAPNSIEIEDTYLRLDQELSTFFKYLDKNIGKNEYVVFLTADHGAAHNPKFLGRNNVYAGVVGNKIFKDVNSELKAKFGYDKLCNHFTNYQIFLNDSIIASAKLDRTAIKATVSAKLMSYKEVAFVIDMENVSNTAIPDHIKQMAINGYNKGRSGQLQVILQPGWYESSDSLGTTHGTWNPYDTHIPLLWMGWGIKKGESYEQVTMADISATLAALLHIQMPNACIGKPITNLLK